MVKVLIVDDSLFMRNSIQKMLNSSPNIEVVGMAKNGKEGLEKAKELQPDLITLDIEMPVMDGLTMLKELMQTNPTPVLMVSSLTTAGAEATFKALELGALDFIPKYNDDSFSIEDLQKNLCDKVIAVGRKGNFMRLRARTAALKSTTTSPASTRPAFSSSSTTQASQGTKASTSHATQTGFVSSARPSASTSAPKTMPTGSPKRTYIGVGISTGGPPAIQKVLVALPEDFKPSIVIAQHMPAAFTKAFAERLNNICKITVKEAEEGEVLKPGHAYVAPGGQHLSLQRAAAGLKVHLSTEPKSELYKPSANVLFDSLAEVAKNAVGVMMTGMGSDGVNGMTAFKQKGGKVIAQNEDSCVVYGMPKAVVDAGIADVIVDVDKIADAIIEAIYS